MAGTADSGDPASVVQRHIDAFNAQEIDALMACFSDDATWVTGTYRLEGAAALRELFVAAFAELRPQLQLLNLLAQGEHVACELRESYVAGGIDRTDHIAGFYRVARGLIAAAKIYREGSADVDPESV